MKKLLFIAGFALLSFSLFSQEAFIKQSLVINVEVPVRVFKDGKFVENLTINDFEVFEDGISQKIEAVYLVKKRTIERSEEKKRFVPETSRNFFLFFEISDYNPRIGEAIDYFVHNIIFPGDNLMVVTPMKNYRLKNKAFEVKSRKQIEKELKGLLRQDVLTGNSEYRSTIEELKVLTRSLSAAIKPLEPDSNTGIVKGSRTPEELDSFSTDRFSGMDFDEQLLYYAGLLQKLEILRKVDQMKLLDFANFLKDKEGQKYIFWFYQREFIPRIEPRTLIDYMNFHQENPVVMQALSGLSNLSERDISIDVNRVKQAYADSSTSIHFLFITPPRKQISGIYFEEQSGDIYSTFREMAKSTGGFTDSSANPLSLFKRALEASENYYLLYYLPKDYKSDGKFKEIKVRVKKKDYKVIHRAGYFAY